MPQIAREPTRRYGTHPPGVRSQVRRLSAVAFATAAPALVGASTAFAQAPTFGEDLDAAKVQYFGGDRQGALDAFQRLQLRALQNPDAQPWSEVVEALTYLGELHVRLGDDDAAQRVFRYLLERDLELVVSPYRHPVEVVFLFDQVRNQVAAERAADVLPTRPPPAPRWHAHLPFGLPQLAQGRTGAGVAYGVGQAALLGTSVWMFADLRRNNVDPTTRPQGWTLDQMQDQVAVRRWAVQWPATLAFYGLWTVSVFDARAHWRREHVEAQVRLVPGAGGVPGLTVAARLGPGRRTTR